jgi:hypothetical protein
LEDATNHVLTIHSPGIEGSVPVGVLADKFSSGAQLTASTEIGESECVIEIQRLGLWDMIIQIVPGPILFLILLGSGGGGSLRSFWPKAPVGQAWYWCLLEGLLAGPLVVAVVLGLGIKLPIGEIPAHILSNPLALIGLSAIGGFGGAAFFSKITGTEGKPAQE